MSLEHRGFHSEREETVIYVQWSVDFRNDAKEARSSTYYKISSRTADNKIRWYQRSRWFYSQKDTSRGMFTARSLSRYLLSSGSIQLKRTRRNMKKKKESSILNETIDSQEQTQGKKNIPACVSMGRILETPAQQVDSLSLANKRSNEREIFR